MNVYSRLYVDNDGDIKLAVDRGGEKKEFKIIDFYDEQYYKELDEVSLSFSRFRSEYINELFVYYKEKIVFYKIVLERIGVGFLDLNNYSGDDHLFWIQAARDVKGKRIKVDYGRAKIVTDVVKFTVTSIVYFLLSLGYCAISTIFHLLYYKKFTKNTRNVFIIRTFASESKLKRYSKNFNNKEFLYDSINTIKPNSVFCYGGLGFRLIALFKLVFMSLKDIWSVVIISKKCVGVYLIPEIIKFYSKRFPHTNMFKVFFEFYVKNNSESIFFTGDMLDRFALIEEDIIRKYNSKLICVPHGIEWGYRLPREYVGDIFYTTTKKSCEILKSIYCSEKFRFDKNVTKSLFQISELHSGHSHQFIFFTQPDDIKTNKEIIKLLVDGLGEGKILYLKLHPRDRIENYNEIKDNVKIVRETDGYIVNNICIARTSTVLLEAVHNNSVAISFLINNKDNIDVNYKYISIGDETISKVRSIKEMELVLGNILRAPRG